MTSSGEFCHLCKRFPNLYIKWIQIYRKLNYGRVFCQYPNTINTFQWQICCLNSKTFSKKFFFWDLLCKKEIEDKILNSFFGSAKRTFKYTKFTYLQLLHISSFPWSLSSHHDDHTRSILSSIHYQITCSIKSSQDIQKTISEKNLLSQL